MFTRDPKTAKIGEEILPLDVGYLPEFFKKKGEDELNYTQSARDKCLRKLNEAIANDKTLKNLKLTDESLLLFLNSRKYDIERTVLQLHKYVKFRKANPQWFTNITFEVLSPLIRFFTILPWRCQDGCTLVLVRPGMFNPETDTVEMIMKMFITLLLQGLRDPMTQVNGFKIIYDLDIGLQVLKFCTPHNVYQTYSIIERVLAARVKEHHLINMGAAGRIVWHIGKMLISEKVKKRVYVHETVDKLLDFLPNSVLPVEYGGDLKEYDWEVWLRKLTSPEELAALNVLSN